MLTTEELDKIIDGNNLLTSKPSGLRGSALLESLKVQPVPQQTPPTPQPAEKPGFFGRLTERLKRGITEQQELETQEDKDEIKQSIRVYW